jgi:hypothetical protein
MLKGKGEQVSQRNIINFSLASDSYRSLQYLCKQLTSSKRQSTEYLLKDYLSSMEVSVFLSSDSCRLRTARSETCEDQNAHCKHEFTFAFCNLSFAF